MFHATGGMQVSSLTSLVSTDPAIFVIGGQHGQTICSIGGAFSHYSSLLSPEGLDKVFKSTHLHKEIEKLNVGVCKSCSRLGASSFVAG